MGPINITPHIPYNNPTATLPKVTQHQFSALISNVPITHKNYQGPFSTWANCTNTNTLTTIPCTLTSAQSYLHTNTTELRLTQNFKSTKLVGEHELGCHWTAKTSKDVPILHNASNPMIKFPCNLCKTLIDQSNHENTNR
jgi:hypothetical protein